MTELLVNLTLIPVCIIAWVYVVALIVAIIDKLTNR